MDGCQITPGTRPHLVCVCLQQCVEARLEELRLLCLTQVKTSIHKCSHKAVMNPYQEDADKHVKIVNTGQT